MADDEVDESEAAFEALVARIGSEGAGEEARRQRAQVTWLAGEYVRLHGILAGIAALVGRATAGPAADVRDENAGLRGSVAAIGALVRHALDSEAGHSARLLLRVDGLTRRTEAVQAETVLTLIETEQALQDARRGRAESAALRARLNRIDRAARPGRPGDDSGP